jgi:hypothetical protein
MEESLVDNVSGNIRDEYPQCAFNRLIQKFQCHDVFIFRAVERLQFIVLASRIYSGQNENQPVPIPTPAI